MKTNTDYKVNNNALNNGKQTIYSEKVTIFNKGFTRITLNGIIENASQAHGSKV